MTTPTPHVAPELLPCPFCGGEPEFENTDEIAQLRCTSCGALTGIFFFSMEEIQFGLYEATEARAKAAWNRRAIQQAAGAVPEGCTPADAQMLRAANHQLAEENAAIRKLLRPFAELARPELSRATVSYMVKQDPERQHFQTPTMHRAFNRAAEALWADYSAAPTSPVQPDSGHLGAGAGGGVKVPHCEAESLARRFHEAYERLAPSFGYTTRADTKEFDPTTDNGRLMIAVCRELLIPWRPIKTAPKNVDVLACNPCGFVGRAYQDSKGRWNHIGNPTHWMPLPAAPAQGEVGR